MAPFPSARVIPNGWAEHHRPVVENAMTAACIITAGGTGGWSPTTGPGAGTAPATLYTGPCRVQALNSGAGPDDAAGQSTIERPYLVAIRADVGEISVGARVKVITCPDDARLVGKTLTVREVRYGSQRWERDLVCDLDLTNQEA